MVEEEEVVVCGMRVLDLVTIDPRCDARTNK